MRIRSILRAIVRLAINPNCDWCGGSGTWNGFPCIKCNPVTTGDDD